MTRTRRVLQGAATKRWMPPGWRAKHWKRPPRRLGWGVLLALAVGVVLFAALTCCPFAGADEAQPAVPSIAITSEGWVWAQSYWTPGADRRDLAGGRFQAWLQAAHVLAAVRADATGLPGEFQPDKYSTFRTVSFGGVVGWRVGCLDGVCVAPAVAAEYAISLEKLDGKLPVFPKAFTAGVGTHVSGPGWWAIVVVGQSQALRGVSASATWQVRLSDRTASIGSVTIGGGGHGSPVYTLSTGVAVRWK